MFYALGSIGSFSDGYRNRKKEIRNERTAIREEFERWKAANPYATAMDFHAKVKQLGSTSPGGNVALPDSASIQRMAAENLRRKQEEDAEKARRRRIQDMDMKIKETTYARQLLMDNPNMSASQLLNSMGMPTTGATLEWAEGLQQKMKTELEQAQADRARKLEQENFRRQQELAGLEMSFYEANPAATEADRNAFMAQFGGATPAAPSVAAPATPDPTYGPTVPSKPPAPAKPASNARLQTFIDGQFSGKQGQYLGPDGFEQLKKDVIRTARMGGARSASDAEIIAALEASDFFADYSKSADDAAFANQFSGKQPSELSITVGEGKNAMAIELAEIYNSQLNNSNILSSRRVPYNKLDEFQSIVAPYFEVVDGEAKMKEIQDVPMEQVLAQVEQQLNAAGIYNEGQLTQMRQQKIAEYGQVDSLDIVLAEQKDQLDKVVEEAAALMKSAGSAAEQSAVLANVAKRFDYFKGLIEGDRIADIYANDGIYPLDILPTNQHALYQKDAFYALFDDAMAELNQIAAANKAKVSTSGEVKEAEEEGLRVDRATNVASESVSDNEVNAAIEALGGYGISQGLFVGFNTDESGDFYREPVPTKELATALLQGEAKVKGAVVQAMASAFEAFEAQRGTGLQYERPTGRKGLFSNIAGFIEAEISGVQQAMSQFPGYNRAVEDATKQFRTTLEMTTGTSGLSSGEISALTSDFDAYIKQATRQRTLTTNAFDMTPRTPNVTQTNLLGRPAQPMTSEQMLQQSVPGAQFVVPN